MRTSTESFRNLVEAGYYAWCAICDRPVESIESVVIPGRSTGLFPLVCQAIDHLHIILSPCAHNSDDVVGQGGFYSVGVVSAVEGDWAGPIPVLTVAGR